MTSEIFPVPPQVSQTAYFNEEQYKELYKQSIEQPEKFWAQKAEEFLTWDRKWEKVLEHDYHKAQIKWFSGGHLNVSVNCVDRHLASRGDKVAIIWEGNEPGDVRKFTYREVHAEVCRMANVLRAHGVKKGDRVAVYLPMVPEAAFTMLACARIGAVHSVIFGGFSADAVRDRILDSTCKVLVTADEGVRGPKSIPLKKIADEAVAQTACIEKVLVLRRTGNPVPMKEGRDLWLHSELSKVPAECPPESMEAEDPLFILYTSGSTGKPKGALHTTAGYLLYTSVTHKYVFDYKEKDIFFCTADIGWVTGHSYVVYGPLANGATTVMFESIPTYPDAGRYWDVVQRHAVTIFYTAPTAIRSLEREGNEFVEKYDLSSLRILGSVGEPINEDAWLWYYNVVGKGRCQVVDTWWQTETGGILISPLPGATALKPGSATRPLFGIRPSLMDSQGKVMTENEVEGRLCIDFPWPGQMRTVYGDHQRFVDTYFSQYPGRYFTGDACKRDKDGYYWIIGRVDDVLNVAGHRIGTAEIESAVVHSGAVVEAAAVGMPHSIKGTGIYVFCILHPDVNEDVTTEMKVKESVRKVIGPFATPDVIQFVPGLPKTRSGKIMRRILRKIAAGETENLGDLTTLADPAVVETIKDGAALRLKMAV